MERVELKLEFVKSELMDLKFKKDIVWKSFPYNKNNLKIVKTAIKVLSNKNNLYRLTYDENVIFVQKDIWI